MDPNRLLCLIATYNTNLQGKDGLPQDLVDWLSPTFTVSNFLSGERRDPDIVAVGFQELLPLQFGLAGLSKSVMDNRASLILSQIETHSPGKERYTLVARAVNVGVALLVFARDAGISRRISDIQTQWTGCGPLYMGNKGAVGVRFRVAAEDGGLGEIYTFVCAHLTAHAHRLSDRVADYRHIVSTLLFPPPPSQPSGPLTTIYSTSHLFFFGDLNFRLIIPPEHSLFSSTNGSTDVTKAARSYEIWRALSSDSGREELKGYDQLHGEVQKGTVAQGLREGEFWKFKCTYKYKLGEVDQYSGKREPSWTDRILYATYSDPQSREEPSNLDILVYTSVPSYTTSDHKPVVALFSLPLSQSQVSIPLLPQSPPFQPDPYWILKRWSGKLVGWPIGWIWCIISFAGLGSAALGLFNFVIALGAWKWFTSRRPQVVLP